MRHDMHRQRVDITLFATVDNAGKPKIKIGGYH